MSRHNAKSNKKRSPFQSFSLDDRQADMVSKFLTHLGNQCPVSPNRFVIYRTVAENPGGVLAYSHIHAPVMAGLINWGNASFGRIHDYMVVETKDESFFKQKIEGLAYSKKASLGMV
jgi:hypothetical protein